MNKYANIKWDEEVKEPNRIEVKEIRYRGNVQDGYDVKVYTNKLIPIDKWKLAQQSLEQVLNDEGFLIPKGHYMDEYLKSFYTQEQVNKMMEDAFNAARERRIFVPINPPPEKYPTFQDYQKSKQQ